MDSADIKLLVSPWAQAFEAFAQSIISSAVIVSPFVSTPGLARLAMCLRPKRAINVQILTNLSIDNMVQGSCDPRAFLNFCNAVPSTTVRHLPGLHAKVYIADQSLAIITSANLTGGGLIENYEYGIQLTDPSVVARVREDVDGYADLGAEILLDELMQLAEAKEELQQRHSEVLASAKQQLRE